MAFINYFSNLFTAGDGVDMEPCLEFLKARVSRDMNAKLLKEFSRDEISVALFQMGPDKAPSPDDFTAGVFLRKIGGLWAMRYVE